MYGQYEVKPASEYMMLGVGQPSPDVLLNSMNFINCPVKNHNVLQYGIKSGFMDFKKLVCKFYKNFTNVDIYPHNIYMTNGVSQAVYFLASLFKNKGYETVYVEDLTYFIMINVFKDLGFNIKVLDFNNIQVDKKSIIYIIPFCNNPTGKNLSEDKFITLLNCIDSESIILSDETYHFLQYEPINTKSLATYDTRVLSLGTFSKILAPGIRLGWIMAFNNEIFQMLDNTGFMDSGGSVNPVMAYMVAKEINENFNGYTYFLKDTVNELKIKNRLIQEMFKNYPNHFEFTNPDGGYFLFVKSKKTTSDELLKLANECKLSFHQADKFSVSKTHPNEFRISVSYYSYRDFEQYFKPRLAELVKLIDKHFYKISLYGKGRLGKLIEHELSLDKNIGYTTIDRTLKKEDIGDIVIDVTSPEGTVSLINKCNEYNIKPKLIIGTTGHNSDQLYIIKDYANKAPVLYCSNFSDGIQNLIKMIKQLNFDATNIEITDIHHIHKKDSPSGTAKLLENELKKIYNIPIEIKSVREGEVVGYHSITLKNDNETVALTHVALNRNIFAKGCMKLIEVIANTDKGFYT